MSKRAEDVVLKALQAKHGKESAVLLGDNDARCVVSEVIPTGLNVLDHYVLGVGGLPVGRMSELYSEEGTGKSSIMLRCIAQAQRGGGVVVLVETEGALDTAWAANVHGVDLARLILIEPGCLEDATQAIETVLNSCCGNAAGPSLVAWDSVAATPTRREIDDGLSGTDRVGDRAKALSKMCRALIVKLKGCRAHLMLINQVRDNIGVSFGDKFTTPGGHAIKFHATIRLQLLGGKAYKDDDGAHLGKDVTVLASKNKLHAPWRKARLRLDYKDGWNEEWSTLTHAKEAGVIEPRRRGAEAYSEALDKLGWK